MTPYICMKRTLLTFALGCLGLLSIQAQKTVIRISTADSRVAFFKWDCNSPITNIYFMKVGIPVLSASWMSSRVVEITAL